MFNTETLSGDAPGWQGFWFRPGEIECPDGNLVSAQQLRKLAHQLYLHRTI